MSCPFDPGNRGPMAGRRGFLTGAAGLVGGLALAGPVRAAVPRAATNPEVIDFYGQHQAGIATPVQRQTYFAAFDIVAERRDEVAALMRAWTEAAAKMAGGLPVGKFDAGPGATAPDGGDARDLDPARLTVTFGFGAGLFAHDGVDRFGLAKHRPAALVDLPRFVGDQLVPERTGGDLSVQVCSDDPQVNLHAIRQLMRLADGVAKVRWVQAGFVSGKDLNGAPRNLMGFKDGTINVLARDPAALARHVWVGSEGDWMQGGSYLVARPIRIALAHWDQMKLGFQEQTMGRIKATGASIGAKSDTVPLDLAATDRDGNPVIAENAHVRLAAPEMNDGEEILRRGYSYDNGVSFVAERWPPWRQGMALDAGLLFICYQRDPRTGFIRIFDKMAKFDMLNQFVTHVGGGLFACPGGVRPGGYVGQALFGSV